MRVFLAVTAELLHRLDELGAVEASLEGFAATEPLTSRLVLEGEELDLALAVAAADVSREAALASGLTTGRRLVVVADVPDDDVVVVSADGGDVRLPGGIAVGRVAAVLADATPVDLTDVDDDGLAWFAAQEIDGLV